MQLRRGDPVPSPTSARGWDPRAVFITQEGDRVTLGGGMDHTVSYTYFLLFIHSPNEVGGENSSRRTLLKDREVEAVPPPRSAFAV